MWRTPQLVVVVVVVVFLLLISWTMLASCSSPKPLPPEPPPSKPVSDPETDLEQTTRNVIIANRPRLRACYEDALVSTPDLEGHVVLVVEVGQNGKATRVLEGRRDGLPDDVIKCLARVLKTIAFHDGAARTVRVQVPLAFSKRE